jgi:hypothetical protein
MGVVPGFHIDQFIAFFRQNQCGGDLPIRFTKDATQLHDHTEIRRNPFDAMLAIQRIDQTGEVAYIVLKRGWFKLNTSFEDGRIYIPTLNELVDILRREKIFVNRPVVFELENRSIHLGFERYFNLNITLDRSQTGQPISLVNLPLGEFWMFWGIDDPLQDFDLTLSAGCTSTARGIDMNPCFHGCLKEVLSLIHQNLSFTGEENYIMFWHFTNLIVTQSRLDFDRGGTEKWF